MLSGLPPGWATVRSPRLGGAVTAIGPGGVLVVAADAEVARAAGRRVAELLGLDPVLVHLVAAGPGDPADAGGSDPLVPDLLVCAEDEAVRTLSAGPRVLSPGETAALGLRLDARLRVPTSTGARRPLSRPAVVLLVVLGLLLAALLALVGSQVAPRLGGGPGDVVPVTPVA